MDFVSQNASYQRIIGTGMRFDSKQAKSIESACYRMICDESDSLRLEAKSLVRQSSF
jgi:hypothetical protein